MVLQTETEEKIVASAEKLFYQKGKAGTSMQDIADDAGMNRTLLNYYYRSKDQLFEAVFRKALGRFVPSLAAMLHSDISFEEYVPVMIETVIDTMIDNPQIPIFVLQELSSNPQRMPEIIREMGINPAVAMKKMASEGTLSVEQGIDPRQFIINLLSLCIFPFAARPVITDILFEGDNEAYLSAMKERKKLIPQIVKQIMMQNPSK
ncbi:MAG: TetR/AcrR family transcriptional regulator [Bacteroidia bacterium]|nr:MAG: TetR/AcrR family transcriptional regulator [Bacteroidia bacterium]